MFHPGPSRNQYARIIGLRIVQQAFGPQGQRMPQWPCPEHDNRRHLDSRIGLFKSYAAPLPGHPEKLNQICASCVGQGLAWRFAVRFDLQPIIP